MSPAVANQGLDLFCGRVRVGDSFQLLVSGGMDRPILNLVFTVLVPYGVRLIAVVLGATSAGLLLLQSGELLLRAQERRQWGPQVFLIGALPRGFERHGLAS